MTAPDQRAYHHGDLANTLMDSALAHISEEGVQSLSLRALARKAGVSATAPYRHFPSKRCLLAALATRGFEQLTLQLQQARSRSASTAGPHSLARIETAFIALGLAYIQFATTHPTTYQLMFGAVIDDFSDYESLEAAAECSYAVLNLTLQELRAEGVGTHLNLNQLGGAVWGGVHGIASLIIGNKATGSALAGLDLQRTGALQAIVALRTDPEPALRALFTPLMRSTP